MHEQTLTREELLQIYCNGLRNNTPEVDFVLDLIVETDDHTLSAMIEELHLQMLELRREGGG